MTKQEFLKRSINKHGYKYNYSLIPEKISSKDRVIIIDKENNIKFIQVSLTHYVGGIPSTPLNQEESNKYFMWKANKTHNYKYNYSKSKYIKNDIKLEIICSDHGSFWQTPSDHYNGCGCPKCSMEVWDTKSFICKANKIHKNKYDYSKTKYTNSCTNTIIICPEHGEFLQTPSNHLYGQGCSQCVGKSKGEMRIIEWLQQNKIKYILEYTFADCLNNKGNKLFYDFYLPQLNTLIEYDGGQHFRPIKFFGGEKEYRRIQQSDELKNTYATQNNIQLLRIPYTKYINISKILEEQIYEIFTQLSPPR